MKLNFDLNNSVEKTEVVLGKKNYDKFGSLTNITDLTYDYNLMSAKSISFVVHKSLNNQDERLWNQIRDRRLIWVKEYDEWFEINVNIDEENEIKKEVTGTSLCEAELGQININSTEINTEDDIAREEYVNPTVFYKPSEPKESLLHRVLKKAPNYSIAYVDKSLWNIQRTFSFDGSSLYDVLTGEIAKEIGCLFLFNSSNRTISVYDLQTNCLECGHRGSFTDTCPECGGTNLDYGYGYDTSIFIDSENLAENITLTGKQDEVKNYIKVCGGDDVINTAISACNPTGTQYIFTFTKEDKEDMTEELSSKLDEYLKEYNRLTPDYKDIMGQIYDKLDEELKLESTMMPDITMAETDAKKELAKLVAKNLAPISVTDVSIASLPTVNNAVLSMAKCVVNSTVFKIEFIDGSTSFSSQTWKGKFRVTNNSDEEDTAENDNFITLKVDDDYANYVEQKVKKIINRNDKYLVDIFDSKTDFEVFKAELKKYCLKRLESFESAYASIIEVMTEAGVANESTYGDIYNDLYLPYYNKLKAIQEEISVREAELESVRKELEELDKLRTQITSYLNLENFLGGELWKELCAFRREDTYENSNYVSDGLSNNEVIEKAQELLNKARNELITTSTTQWSLSATLYNLLAMPEFSKLTGMFNGGNWIRIKIDDKIYRLRLVHYRLSDNDIQNLEVEFSDVTQTANGLNDINSLMSKVQSMATNFSAVVHQAEQGEKSFTELDKIRNDGLNTALYSISNSINQDFIIDEHGITGRMYDDILGTFAPEQVKINHNTIVWTDDYWQTAKCALGKIEYYNPILGTNIKQYGLLADAVIAGILMGNDIIGGDIYSENYSSTVGTHINLNNGDFSFAGGKLTYNSTDNEMTLKGVTIEWASSTTPEISDINGLEDRFKGVNEYLDQLDDRIQSFSQSDDPSTDWNTDDLKEKHKGDLWFNPNNGLTKRWNGTLWETITDSILEDLAKSKAQIFTSIPIKGYKKNDLWILNENCYPDQLVYVDGITGKQYLYPLYKKGTILVATADNDGYSEKDWTEQTRYTDDSNLNIFIEEYEKTISDLQTQADKKAETWYQDTDPSSSWNDDEKEEHKGDLWYNTSDQNTYIYNGTTWEQTKSTPPDAVFDKIDGKAQIFVNQPTTPYNVGDLWVQGSDGDILNCVNTRLDGDFVETDWSKSSKYTDDTALTTFINGSYKDALSDIETQIDGKARSWYQSTDPSLTWNKSEDHEGDLWYNTSADSHVTYIYQNSAWRATDVPKTLFDTIDGIASIYVTVPSNPVVGDLLIPTSDTENYKSGKVYKYDGSTWIEISYTDDTSVNNLDTKITQILSGEYKTTIGEDYVISPYIAGGYLYISDTKGSVLIDPQGIKKSDHIFSISNSSNSIVMGVDINGNGIFEGKVTSNSGKIGGWNITSSSLYNGTNSMSSTIQGTYIGTSGIRQYNSSSAYVNIQNGVLTADGAIINSGKIGGWTLSTNALYSRGENQGGGYGTAYYTYIQPFLTTTSEHLEDSWVISSQYATLSGGEEGTRYPFWYVTVAGDMYTKGKIELASKDYPQLYGNGSYLHINHTNSNNNGLVLDLSSIRPAGNGNQTLGTSDHRWGQIYSSNSAISTSDRNEKNTINTLDEDLSKKLIMSLNPVSYKYNNGTSDRLHYGLISQDVEDSLNQLNISTKDFAGFIKTPKTETNYDTMEETIVEGEYTYGLRYEEFIAPLIKLVQVQENRIKKLEEEIEKINNN